MSVVSPAPTALDSTMGAAFVGNSVATILFGVTSVQTYTYFSLKKKDKAWFRGLMFLLWILDGVALAFITHSLYFYLVSKYGIPQALETSTWSFIAQIFVSSFSDFTVKIIFTRRVWLVSKNYVLTILIAVTTLTHFITAYIFASLAWKIRVLADFGQVSYVLLTTFGSSVVSDFLIAGSLCYNLSKRRTGFKRTDSLINVLILYTINTCLLTSICAGAALIAYAIWPNELIYCGIYFSLSKLYLNSLLSSLNSRQSLSLSTSDDSHISWAGPSLSSQFLASKQSGGTLKRSLLININREVVNDVELKSKRDQVPDMAIP